MGGWGHGPGKGGKPIRGRSRSTFRHGQPELNSTGELWEPAQDMYVAQSYFSQGEMKLGFYNQLHCLRPVGTGSQPHGGTQWTLAVRERPPRNAGAVSLKHRDVH